MVLQVGRPFGNYRIVRLIGEGGFGEVYLAENSLIGRRAVIKILHPILAQDTELVRRFLNEARAASAIRHPNIIEVFDGGTTPEGLPYILMELLDGTSLHSRLAAVGSIPFPYALDIANQAGSALAAAHSAGIVHRDLKPENLFLVPDPNAPRGERVKILDFGIAKIKHRGDGGDTLTTQTGLIMGSPTYMSPEQCKDSADVDLRSDIYSFGIILYEMLAGHPPFVAPTGTELLLMHLTETPQPLREVIPNLPAHAAAAIACALSRERQDRFQDVGAFLDALNGTGFPRSNVATLRMTRDERPAAGDAAVASMSPTVAHAGTTLSHATGELKPQWGIAVNGGGSPLRRRLLLAFGALAIAATAVFLLLPKPTSISGGSEPSPNNVATAEPERALRPEVSPPPADARPTPLPLQTTVARAEPAPKIADTPPKAPPQRHQAGPSGVTSTAKRTVRSRAPAPRPPQATSKPSQENVAGF